MNKIKFRLTKSFRLSTPIGLSWHHGPFEKLNLLAHKILWTAMFLFPSLVKKTGSSQLSQRIFHGLFLLTVLFFSLALLRAPRNWLHWFLARFGAIFLTSVLFFSLVTTLADDWQLSSVPDVARPLFYITYLAFPILVPLSALQLSNLFRFLGKFAVFQVVFSLTCYWPWTSQIHDLFKGRMFSTTWESIHYFRLTGFMVWPSDFSYYLILFSLFYFARFVLESSLSKSIFFLGASTLLTTGVILSGSRGGIIALFFAFGLHFLFLLALAYSKRTKIRLAQCGILVLLLGSIILAVPAAYERLETLPGIDYFLLMFQASNSYNVNTGDGSVAHRMIEFGFAYDLASKHFPFGAGPARELIDNTLGVLESFYGYYLAKWGYFGILLQLLLAMSLLRLALAVLHTIRNCCKSVDNTILFAFVSSYFIWNITMLFVFGFSSAVWDRYKGVFLFYCTSGYVLLMWLSIFRPPYLTNNRQEEPSTVLSS